MAKYIKHSNAGNIVFLYKGNYDQLYSSILHVLGKDAPFAPLTISGRNLTWSPLKADNYISIADAPEDLSGTLGLLWEQKKKEMLAKLSKQNLDYVLDIPDESFVFYAENQEVSDTAINDKYKLIVTGWACKYGRVEDNPGLLGLRQRMMDAKNKHQNVIVEMMDANNSHLSNMEFVYEYEGNTGKQKTIVTDEAGLYNQGLCVVGANLYYTNKITGQKKKIVIQKNIERYPVVFAPTVDINIKIFNQFNSPIQSHKVKIEYGAETFNMDTDGLGEIHLNEILYAGPSLQLHIEVEGLGHYAFTVKCPVTNIIMNVGELPDEIPYIKVVRENEIQPAYSVRISGKMIGTYITNDEGCVMLEGLKWGDTFSVESTSEADATRQDFVIKEGQAEYVYTLPIIQPLPVEPLPVEENPECFIRVVRGAAMKEEVGYSIGIVSPESMKKSGKTDATGRMSLGKPDVGTHIVLICGEERINKDFTIEAEKTEYLITLEDAPREQLVNAKVKVVKGENLIPQINYSIKFDEPEIVKGVQLTNENGIIELGELKVGTKIVAYYSKEQLPVSFVVESGKEEYVIILDEDEPIKKDSPKAYVKVVQLPSMTPIPNLDLKIDRETGSGRFTTNAEGLVEFVNPKDGEDFTVSILDFGVSQKFKISNDLKEYVLYLDESGNQLCHIKVIEGDDNHPVPNYSLRIESSTMQGNFQTNEMGVLPLKDMKPGDVFKCYIDLESQPLSFTIEEGVEEYLIKLNQPVPIQKGDIVITFLGKDRKTPVVGSVVTLTNSQKKTFVHNTDSKGSFIVPRAFFTDKEKVHFHAELENYKLKDCKFKFFKEQDHYMIYIKENIKWLRLLWLLLLPLLLLLSLIGCEKDITIHAVDTTGNNVPGANVELTYVEHALYKKDNTGKGEFFYNRVHNIQGMTDKSGNYTFKNVPCSMYSYIFYCFQDAMASGKKNMQNGGTKNFIFHWRSNVDVLFIYKKVVQVRSKSTDQPIAQARVDVCQMSDKDIDSTLYTDNAGNCCFIVKKNSSYKLIKQITVTKNGFSGQRIKNVQLEKDSLPLIVYLDRPEPCQDKEDNNSDRSQGDFALRDYDMGKEGGTFVFNYYTDSAPDDISVYDGSSSDYMEGNAQCIFRYSGATNTTTYKDYKNVKFKSRFICVVVKGGTNWGYIVRCPFE